MFGHALLAQGLVVTHAKHVDVLLVLRANRILSPGLHLIHAAPHLALNQLLLLLASLATHIVTHI